MNKFFNMDCVLGSKTHLKDNSVDLIITDPPYGINGDQLDKHYNRNESNVIDGYIEIPSNIYPKFSSEWIKEAERVLKPGGSIYIVSGYTNLIHILNALNKTQLKEVNHIIWKYNFGVFTSKKFVSSHYHILYYEKPGKDRTFNTFCRYADFEVNEENGKLNYLDREDVWEIKKEYKPNQIKNKNQLPTELLIKMIQYSSNEGDLVCDFFLGSFSTAKVAIGLNRNAVGFELSKNAFDYQSREMEMIKRGHLLEKLRPVPINKSVNKGKPISDIEREMILKDFSELINSGYTKKNSINLLSDKYKRGFFSITNIVNEINIYEIKSDTQLIFFSEPRAK